MADEDDSFLSSTKMDRILNDNQGASRLSLMPSFVVNWFQSGQTSNTEDPSAVSGTAAPEPRSSSYHWKNGPEGASRSSEPAVRLRPGNSMRIHANDNAAEHSLPKTRPAEQVDSEGNPKTIFDTLLDGLAEVVGNEQREDGDTTNAVAVPSDEHDLELHEYRHTPEELKGKELKAEAEYAIEVATRIVQEDSFMQKLAALDNPQDLFEEEAPPGELDGLDSALGPKAITGYSRLFLPSRLSVESVVSDWGGFSSYAGADQDLEIKWAWRDKQLEKAPEIVVTPEGFRVCGVQTSDVQACPVLRGGSGARWATLFYVDTAAFPNYQVCPFSRTVEQWRNDEMIWTGRVTLVPARSGEGASSDCPPDLPDTMLQGWLDPIQEAEFGDWEAHDLVFVIGSHSHLPPHKRDNTTFSRNLTGYERASTALTRTPNIVGAENVRSASADTVRQALLDAATEKVEESAAREGEVSQSELLKIRGAPRKKLGEWGSLF